MVTSGKMKVFQISLSDKLLNPLLPLYPFLFDVKCDQGKIHNENMQESNENQINLHRASVPNKGSSDRGSLGLSTIRHKIKEKKWAK